jgi:regulator of replication initiation timing
MKLKAGALSKELEEKKSEISSLKSENSSLKSELENAKSAISNSRIRKVLQRTNNNKRVVQQRLSDVGIIGA